MASATELLRAMDRTMAAYRQWAHEDLSWVSPELYEAVGTLVDEWAEEAAPPGYEALLAAIRAIVPGWERWKETADDRGNLLVPIEDSVADFWDLLHALAVRYIEGTTPATKSAPSVAVLSKEQGVPHHQIALIYRWVDRTGFPDVNRVAEELAEPGRHVPKDWVCPEEEQRRKKHESRVADVEAIHERITDAPQAAICAVGWQQAIERQNP